MVDRRQGLYADPALYDILYTPGTAAEIDALEKVEQTIVGDDLRRDRLWFEPACGTGRYLRTADRRGRRIAGFDRDTDQLGYAAGRLPQANLFLADMADYLDKAEAAGIEPSTVDFAFNPVNSLRHLDTDQAMLTHFAHMAELLKPDAVYVVGLSLTDYRWLVPDEDLWEAARGRCHVSQLVNYLPPEPDTALARVEKVVSHLTVTRPGGRTHFDDTYDLRTYDLKQWRDLLKRSRLEHLGSFDAAGQPLNDRVLPYQLEALVTRAAADPGRTSDPVV